MTARLPATMTICFLLFAPLQLSGSEPVRGQDVPATVVRHLFLDPAILKSNTGATLAVNSPEQREIVIRADQPWEQLMISLFLTVRDEGDKLRMWYVCRDLRNRPNLAYAESNDGINWTKPNLGIVEYEGSTENNLVGVHSLEGVVFRDPQATDSNEAYLYLTTIHGKGLVRFTSPDGLRWRQHDPVLLPFSLDTQNVTFWDERLGCYVLYLRGWTKGEQWQDRLRNVKRITVKDLTKPFVLASSGNQNASSSKGRATHLRDEVKTIFAADEQDPPNCDVYNMSTQPYPLDPRWYVAFPSFLLREKSMVDGRLEMHFAGSRDGITWHRYDRRPYAKPGLTGTENANMVFMGTGLVIRDQEIWQYGVGLHTRHGNMKARYEKTDGTIYRYVQRIDGFVSLDFPNEGGSCQTVPIRVDGNSLVFNVDTGALGQIQVGLLDEDGQPIPGFSIDDCLPLRTNALAAEVQWRGKPNLKAWHGKELQLEIRGARSKLYSFYFK